MEAKTLTCWIRVYGTEKQNGKWKYLGCKGRNSDLFRGCKIMIKKKKKKSFEGCRKQRNEVSESFGGCENCWGGCEEKIYKMQNRPFRGCKQT